MQHLYNVQSSTNTNTSATNIPAANTSSAELCSITADDMSLSNELQNALSAVSVSIVQTANFNSIFCSWEFEDKNKKQNEVSSAIVFF
jgi:hypothetical protein